MKMNECLGTVLITGGTGTLGRELIKQLLNTNIVVVYSRDEYKQEMIRRMYPDVTTALGDIRDAKRLQQVIGNGKIETVIHAAALKQVPGGDAAAPEFIQTNIIGTENVVEACLTCGVNRMVFTSSDKAVEAVNLYGMTKAVGERLVVGGNQRSYTTQLTQFACTRYGNVLGSRGSVLPLWVRQAREGRPITVTNILMNRFWLTVKQAAEFVLGAARDQVGSRVGGEIYVPVLPAMWMVELAEVVRNVVTGGKGETRFVGSRMGGEKLSESLVGVEESLCAVREGQTFIIHPTPQHTMPFRYESKMPDRWITKDEMRGMVEEYILQAEEERRLW